MTTLSELFPNSAIKSIQTGLVDATATSGSGQDAYFVDITISPVVQAKSQVFVTGSSAPQAFYGGVIFSSSYVGWFLFGRLTSATNLRIYTPNNGQYFECSWTVVEYN